MPPRGSKLLPRASQDDPLELHGRAQTSKNQEKPKENMCFYDIHKIALGHPWAPHFAPQVLQMRPQMAQKEPKDQRVLICDPFLSYFSHKNDKKSILGGPSAPKDAQDIQNVPKSDPGHLNINTIEHILEVFQCK